MLNRKLESMVVGFCKGTPSIKGHLKYRSLSMEIERKRDTKGKTFKCGTKCLKRDPCFIAFTLFKEFGTCVFKGLVRNINNITEKLGGGLLQVDRSLLQTSNGLV